MSIPDQYRMIALKLFIAAEETDDPDAVHRLLDTAHQCMRSAAIEAASYHALAWGNKARRTSAQHSAPLIRDPD